MTNVTVETVIGIAIIYCSCFLREKFAYYTVRKSDPEQTKHHGRINGRTLATYDTKREAINSALGELFAMESNPVTIK